MLLGRNLASWRGERCLFTNLNIELNPGEILYVRGANGSGKTTLLRVLCGLRALHEGSLYWRGQPIDEAPQEFRRELAFLGHNDGVKADLTALQNTTVLSALRGGEVGIDTESALREVGLGAVMDLRSRALSAGQRRRVALAALLTRQLPLWILDEPFNALDQAGLILVGNLLERHRLSGGAAIITSHQELPQSLTIERTVDLGK